MSTSPSPSPTPEPVRSGADTVSPARSGWAFSEDWAAVVVGLALLGLVLLGAIPEGWVP